MNKNRIADFGVYSAVDTQAGSAIIWTVGRPTNLNSPYVNLYAFAATASGGTYALLYSATAGYWPSPDANANIVPVVANGKVYVASYKVIAIFGIPPPMLPKSRRKWCWDRPPLHRWRARTSSPGRSKRSTAQS